MFYLLKTLAPTRGLPGAQRDLPRNQQAGRAVAWRSAPELWVHAWRGEQVCPGVSTTKGRLKASPEGQAGSVSRGNRLVGPLLGRAAFQGTKVEGAGRPTWERHKLLSHCRRGLPADERACLCAGLARRTLSCPARSHSDPLLTKTSIPPSPP